MDDSSLIRLFIQGQAQLAANEHLRVQPALDTEQLIARNGQILAIARLQITPPTVHVRPKSTYLKLIDRSLRSQAFFPVKSKAPQGFLCYRYYTVPAGYKPKCAPARLLWRQWWVRHRQGRPRLAEFDLALFVHGDWCPIRNIIFNHSTLFITTHQGESAHQGEDLVVWIEKDTSPATAFTPRSPTYPRSRQRVYAALNKRKAQYPGASCLQPVSSALVEGLQALPQPWHRFVREEAGKLYVKTPLGELRVEGTNLRISGSAPDEEAF